MSDRERKFRELLKANGVTKCYVDSTIDFNDIYSQGRIFVDNPDKAFHFDIYALFSDNEDRLLNDDQMIIVRYDSFEDCEPNYKF